MTQRTHAHHLGNLLRRTRAGLATNASPVRSFSCGAPPWFGDDQLVDRVVLKLLRREKLRFGAGDGACAVCSREYATSNQISSRRRRAPLPLLADHAPSARTACSERNCRCCAGNIRFIHGASHVEEKVISEEIRPSCIFQRITRCATCSMSFCAACRFYDVEHRVVLRDEIPDEIVRSFPACVQRARRHFVAL